MTKNSGGTAIDRSPAPEPDRDPAGKVAGNVREKGGDPPDHRETSPGDEPAPADATAHDRAS
jgi:hypothetical protein